MLVPLTLSCLISAAAVHDLPPAIMVGILDVEGGRVGFERTNTNGTRDLGPLQINTLWVPVVAKAHGLAEGSVERALRDDGCYNARMAAWILRRCIDDVGELWKGIGCYHSRTPHLNQAYQGRVKRALARLYGGEVVAAGRAAGSRPRLVQFEGADRDSQTAAEGGR